MVPLVTTFRLVQVRRPDPYVRARAIRPTTLLVLAVNYTILRSVLRLPVSMDISFAPTKDSASRLEMSEYCDLRTMSSQHKINH